MMSIDVFFDYTCGFSNRARHWLDAVDSEELVWRPFSLLEQHRGADGPPVFDRPDLADDVSLIALAVHEAVRAEGGDVEGYRRRMFTAWHEEPAQLATVDILGFGRDAGLGHFDRDVAFAALGAEHAVGTKLGVFGTPTVVFAPGRVVFVKLDAVPVAERAQPLWDSVGQDSAAVSLPADLALPLRTGRTDVLGWVEQGRCLLDLLAVDPADDERLATAVLACAAPVR